MKKWLLYLFLILTFIICLAPSNSIAQASDEEIELYPTFRYRSVINTVVISKLKNDYFYLPLGELFSALQIDYNVTVINNSVLITGNFLKDETPYRINLGEYSASFGNRNISITSEDVIIGELDYYFTIEFVQEFFGLDFRMDISTLALTLETTKTLPVVEQYLREIKRSRAQNNRNVDRKDYPIVFDRTKNNFNGGFLDYNISNYYSNNINQLSLNNSFGVELLGGDFQGATFFSTSEGQNLFLTRNLKWRYAIRDNPAISSVELGQIRSDGIIGDPYTGIRLTNNPIEPRRLFDEYRINGNTTPESEVELYFNNALIEFQKADALGNYSFLVPLTYGNSNYDVRIFGPSGSVNEISRLIQVPFSFTPPGEIDYNVNIGELDYRLPGKLDTEYFLNGDVSIGLTNWLSGKIGAEYYESFDGKPTYKSSFSARILTNYLFLAEYASDAFLRTTANVVYPNSSGFQMIYTNFLSPISLYNPSQEQQRIFFSGFKPVTLFGLQGGIRLSSTVRTRESQDDSKFRLDLSVKKNRLRSTLSYSDLQIGSINPLDPSALSKIENSYTYSFSRLNNVPKFLIGAFLRAQFSYQPLNNKFERVDFFYSRRIFNQGNIQLSYGRNILGNFNTFNATFVLNFNKIRSNSSAVIRDNNQSFRQNLRGSVGFDSNNDNFIFTNRSQTGRAATAFRLFVDNNANNVFDEGDEKIDDNAIRVDRAGANTSSKDGISYFTQLQPYYKYNMEVSKAAIKNPIIVPKIEKFGVITDPNQFKPIDIPFFMSGVIEGRVDRTDSLGTVLRPVSGLKLNLTRNDGDFDQEIRTFSEGSFYSYEIPPGNYSLSVDSSQLRLLNAESFPQKIDFEVEVTPNGDFIEGLSFVLVPNGAQPLQKNGILIEPILAEIRNSPNMVQLDQRYNNYAEETLQLIIQAQYAYYARDLQRALVLVNESLNLFETAQGYALKGSLNYLNGNKDEAQRNWEKATEFNPKFYVPDLNILDQIIRTELDN